MNSTKLSAFCDKVLEIGWLLAVVITPLLFNVYSSRVFEPDKLTTLRTVTVIMAAAWLVKLIEERANGRHEIGFTWRTPLVFPTLFMVAVYLLSTILSVTPWVSLLGSYQRLQGTYTTLSYIVIFLTILQGLRTHAQLDRLITVTILNSLPIALYGLIQHNGLDPLPWGGDVQTRVAANMGNAIFVAAYLIMIFPLAVGRIAESFKAILTEEESDWADVVRAAGYIFIAAVDLIAIWYTQSRGPLLGLIAASYFLLLLLALSSRTKWGAASTLSIITATALVVGFLAVINTPDGPLQSLQRVPWLGRLGEVFDFEHGTGKVRALIWDGMVDLILPHEPIQYPDGHPDPFNALRPLVGYGPESIYVAYNSFYPPLLGHYESRTASPDRSHNETLDSLAITGLLGLIAYLGIFGSAFYYGFKWLGLVKDRRQRNLLFGLVAGLSACSVAFFWWWQGLNFFGASLTLGIASGLGIYLAITAITSSVRLLRSNEDTLPLLHPHHFLLTSIVAAFMAHFIEINFGIAIASTRTTFWAYAGVLVVAGLGLIRERGMEPQEQKAGDRKQGNKGRKKRHKAAPPPPTKPALTAWLWPTLAVAVVGGFILGTLAFDFTTNAERLSQPLAILWRALTILPAQQGRTSYGALMIFALTWLMSAAIFISEMAKSGAFHEHKSDWSLATSLYLLISLTVGFGLALVLASRQASLVHFQAQTVEDVVSVADRVASLLSAYYGFIIFVLIAGGVALLLGTQRLPRQTAQSFGFAQGGPWSMIVLIVLMVLAGAIAVVTNLHPIQADVVYKQAEPWERDGQWLVAIEHYKHAIQLAPREDQYHLFLGRAYLEYASTIEDPAVRDNILRITEQTLTQAREINPLNTDHSRNLAKMYMRWIQLASDPADHEHLAQQSAENFRIATMLSPNNAELWNEWAGLYQYLGDFDAAKQTLQKSLAVDEGYHVTWLIYGDVNLQSSDLEQAAHCYEEALKLKPSLPQVWRVLSSVYAQLGRLDEAVAALQQALELAPEASDAWDTHRMLAIIYAQSGQNDIALPHAQMALQLAPEDQQTMLQDLIAQIQSLETPQP